MDSNAGNVTSDSMVGGGVVKSTPKESIKLP